MQIVVPYNPSLPSIQEIYIASRLPIDANVDTTTYDFWMIDLETRDRYLIDYQYTRESYYEKITTQFAYTILYSGSGLKEHGLFSLELLDRTTKEQVWKGIIICLSSASATAQNTGKFLSRNRPPQYKEPAFPDERNFSGADGGDYIIYD